MSAPLASQELTQDWIKKMQNCSTLRMALGFLETFRVFDACASNLKSPKGIDISIVPFVLTGRSPVHLKE